MIRQYTRMQRTATDTFERPSPIVEMSGSPVTLPDDAFEVAFSRELLERIDAERRMAAWNLDTTGAVHMLPKRDLDNSPAYAPDQLDTRRKLVLEDRSRVQANRALVQFDVGAPTRATA